MNKSLQLMLIISIFFFISCKKKKIEHVCKTRSIVSMKVLEIKDSDEFDLFDGPDIRIDAKISGNSNWMYSSNVSENVNVYPVNISFPKNFLITDEDWEFRIVDEDLLVDEFICQLKLNPYKLGENGIINVSKDNVNILKISYIDE